MVILHVDGAIDFDVAQNLAWCQSVQLNIGQVQFNLETAFRETLNSHDVRSLILFILEFIIGAENDQVICLVGR